MLVSDPPYPDVIHVDARSDARDYLMSADEPLASLQLRCGGMIPGAIAIPELRELVAKARGFGLKLARPIVAQDGVETIRAWIEVTPQADAGGCAIVLRNWQATAVPPEPADMASRRRMEIDRALAELTARLDARQCLLTVEGEAPDLAEVVAGMRLGLGRPWTDFVTLPGNGQQQPLHWRLLDGAPVTVPGSRRAWRSTLVAQPASDGTIAGFDLCLTSDTPLLAPPGPRLAAAVKANGVSSPVIGRELAPVLRQPIARIIANAETIRTRRAGPLAEDYARYAGDIATAGQHLLGLVEDLADIEVIEGMGFAPASDSIDLADVARRAAGILQVRAREKGITLHAPGAGTQTLAIGEFRRVLQILLNLIGNAIHYSPDHSSISLLMSRIGDRARIAVADQGPGLSPEDAARVFDKFERLGRSGDGGSGLGLYISRRLARAMGGDLTVESGLGSGARFVLELPAR